MRTACIIVAIVLFAVGALGTAVGQFGGLPLIALGLAFWCGSSLLPG